MEKIIEKEKINKNKMVLCRALAVVFSELKKGKSNYIFGAEYDISTSLLNHLERGIKDPQLTTIFKLSEAFDLKASDFVRKLEMNLPSDFSLIEG